MVNKVLYERVSSYFIAIGAPLANLFGAFVLNWSRSSFAYMLVFPVLLSFVFMIFYLIFYKNDINHRYIIENLIVDIIFVIAEFWVLCNIWIICNI